MIDPDNPVLVLKAYHPGSDAEVLFAECADIEEAELFVDNLVRWADPGGVEMGLYRVDPQYAWSHRSARSQRTQDSPA